MRNSLPPMHHAPYAPRVRACTTCTPCTTCTTCTICTVCTRQSTTNAAHPRHATCTIRLLCHCQARLSNFLATYHGTAGKSGSSSQQPAASAGTSDGGAVRSSKYPKKALAAPYPDRRPSFPSGAASPVLSACAICLGRHQHRVYNCDAQKTWDQAHDVASKRVDKSLVLVDSGRTLCGDWQRPNGCSSCMHDSRHLCSGCGKPTHGAQDCPRAQRA